MTNLTDRELAIVRYGKANLERDQADPEFRERVAAGERQQSALEAEYARAAAAASRRRKLPRPTPEQLETKHPITGGSYGLSTHECAPSNVAGTCLWCGKELQPYWRGLNPETDTPRGYGQYADNAFCGLRCGYAFGRAFASFGRRLKPGT